MNQSIILQIARLTAISVICLFFKFSLLAQEMKLFEAPENYQLYPRDKKDSAEVVLSGRISGIKLQQLDLITYKNNKLLEIKTAKISLNENEGSNFYLSQKIKSGLFQYKF